MKERMKLKRRIVYRGQVYDALEAERIKSLGNIFKPYYDGYADGLKRAIQILANEVEDVPSADLQNRPMGKWLPTNDKNKKRCSECDVIHLIAQYPHGKINFCPNCGADMREDRKE